MTELKIFQKENKFLILAATKIKIVTMKFKINNQVHRMIRWTILYNHI